VASARQALVPLGGGRVLLAGGLLAGDVSTGAVTQVDLTTGRTTPAPPLAVPVHDVAAGLAGGAPLVVGGGNATEQDLVQARQGQGWRVVGHLPTTRSDLGVVTLGGHAYVLGGYDGTGTPTQILSVDAHGRSRPVGHLVRGVRYAATALVGHTAYVLGGEVLGQELSTVQRVDLRTGRTRVVARLPGPLGHAAAAAVGGRILLLGGRTSPDRQTSAMWWFDPVSRSFTPAGHLPFAVSDAAVASYRHDVWLLGGEDPSVTDRVAFVRVR
jgi:N-acetylneuraminic acid mutarotase